MVFLTEEEFREVAAKKVIDLMGVSKENSDRFAEMVPILLKVCMFKHFYLVDDAKPNKNKPAKNLFIGNRASALRFYQLQLNLETCEITSLISREEEIVFKGSVIKDPCGHETIFPLYKTIHQVTTRN